MGHGIWANDVGEESIDTVIFHIDIEYLFTLFECWLATTLLPGAAWTTRPRHWHTLRGTARGCASSS